MNFTVGCAHPVVCLTLLWAVTFVTAYFGDGFSQGASLAATDITPIGRNPILEALDDWPGGLSLTSTARYGGLVFDGTFVWTVPLKMNPLLRIEPVSGSIVKFEPWPAGVIGNFFYGGVFDGTYIWMYPGFKGTAVVRVDVGSGAMVWNDAWPDSPATLSMGTSPFCTAAWGAGRVWMAGCKSPKNVGLDPATGNMISVAKATNPGMWVSGMVFDGTYFWIFDRAAGQAVRFDGSSLSEAAFSDAALTASISATPAWMGATFDGSRFVWMIPARHPNVVRFDTSTHTFVTYGGFPASVTMIAGASIAFQGGCYDGEAIWLTPRYSNSLVRVDEVTGEVHAYNDRFPIAVPADAFRGCAFDGKHLFLSMATATAFVRASRPTSTESKTATETSTASIRREIIIGDGVASSYAFSVEPLGSKVKYETFAAGSGRYSHGVFDGTFIWMIPSHAHLPFRMNLEGTGIDAVMPVPGILTPGAASKFSGGVFDGSQVWMIPAKSDGVVALLPDTTMVRYDAWPADLTLIPAQHHFYGGALAPGKLWMTPFNAAKLVIFDIITHGMVTVAGSTSTSFGTLNLQGAIFDGTFVWLVPGKMNVVVRADPRTMLFDEFPNWPSGYVGAGGKKFAGGAFDGTYVYLGPQNTNIVCRIHAKTGVMDKFDAWPSGVSTGDRRWRGATFDGDALWLCPAKGGTLVRVSTADGSMTAYNNWPAGYDANDDGAAGCTFDGKALWLIKAKSPLVLRVSKVTSFTATPSPTRAPTRTVTPSPTASSTASPSMSGTRTVSLSPTTSNTASASIPETSTGTPSSSSSASMTPAPTASSEGSRSGSTSRTMTATLPPLPTATLLSTSSRSLSLSASLPPTPTATRSLTMTNSGSHTDSSSVTAPPTRTWSVSLSPSRSASLTGSGSVTPPPTPSVTATESGAVTSTATGSVTITMAMTATATMQPPIPFAGFVRARDALFVGAVDVPVTLELELGFANTNHRDAALADYALSLNCSSASVRLPPVSTSVVRTGSNATLSLGVAASLGADYRGVSDACNYSVCASILRSCVNGTFVVPVEYPELNLTAVMDDDASLSVAVSLGGRVPAEGVRVIVETTSLVSARTNLTADGRCAYNGTCLLGGLQPGDSVALVPGSVLVPAYYRGSVSVVVAATATNADPVFYVRVLYDAATRTVNASETLVNASGRWEGFAVEEKNLTVLSLPLPAGHAASFPTDPPSGFFADAVRGLSGGDGCGPGGLHFVVVTTLAFAAVLVVGRLVAMVVHRWDAGIAPMSESSLLRVVVQQHVWASVVVPCHHRCVSVHATELYVAVLACYAVCGSCVDVTGSGWDDGSRAALGAIVGAASMSAVRVLTRPLFQMFSVPGMVEYAAGRSKLKQLRMRRTTKKAELRVGGRLSAVASPDLLSSGDGGLFSESDEEAVPYLEMHASFHTALRPIDAEDDDAVEEGDAADVQMELPDAVFPSAAPQNLKEHFTSFDYVAFDDEDMLDELRSHESHVLDMSESDGHSHEKPLKDGATPTTARTLDMPSSSAPGITESTGPLASPLEQLPLIVVDSTAEPQDGDAMEPDCNRLPDSPSSPLRHPGNTENWAASEVAASSPAQRPLTTESEAWHVERLTAANLGSASEAGNTIGRLHGSFAKHRSASPVESLARTNSLSDVSRGSGRRGTYALGSPLAVPAVADTATLPLTLGRYRVAAYAVSVVLSLVLAVVTVSVSSRWGGSELRVFWIAVIAAFAVNAFVMEFVSMLLCAFYRWFVDATYSDEGLLWHLRTRHPYEGEVVDCQKEQTRDAETLPSAVEHVLSASGSVATTSLPLALQVHLPLEVEQD